MNKNRLLKLPALLLLAASAGYGLRVYAESVPRETPLFYGGTLEENGQLVNGVRTISLTAWDAEKEGNVVCTSSTDTVPVSGGRFRMALSEACVAELRAPQKTADVWIAVSVKDEGGTPHDIPGRTKIGAVPFALKAESADSASGQLAGQVVPSGMISMFAGACPAGWSEYTALRGRVPRGEPAGNVSALDQGGSDDAVVVSHTHTGSASGGEHGHASTTEAGNHAHFGDTDGNYAWYTCNVYNAGGNDVTFEPSVHWSGYIGGNCAFRDKTFHNHHFNTNAAGNHAHAIGAAGSAHTHNFTTANAAGGVAAAGQNMQAFREVIFCVKQ